MGSSNSLSEIVSLKVVCVVIVVFILVMRIIYDTGFDKQERKIIRDRGTKMEKRKVQNISCVKYTSAVFRN